MRQKLTKVQKDELHRVLPKQSIEMDQDFHNSAGMLAYAAEMKNADVVNFYFFKLNNACITCHAKYATERFPGLVNGNEVDSHQHLPAYCTSRQRASDPIRVGKNSKNTGFLIKSGDWPTPLLGKGQTGLSFRSDYKITR